MRVKNTIRALTSRFVEPAAAYEDLLPDALRVWGPDHYGTLTLRAYLAEMRGQEEGEGSGL